jgi:hypothetical protein
VCDGFRGQVVEIGFGTGHNMQRSGLDGQSLPLTDDSCDSALST